MNRGRGQRKEGGGPRTAAGPAWIRAVVSARQRDSGTQLVAAGLPTAAGILPPGSGPGLVSAHENQL